MKLIISEKSSNNNAQPIDNLRSNVDSDTDSWSRNYLIDVLKQYLATYVLEIVNDKGESVTSRKYYDLAFKLITCFSRVMLLMREVRRDYRFSPKYIRGLVYKKTEDSETYRKSNQNNTLESFDDKNRAQKTSDIPNDHGLTERANRSELEQSFGKNDQNCAQNMAPNDPNDSNDTFRSSEEGNPSYAGAEVGAEIRQELTRMQNRRDAEEQR